MDSSRKCNLIGHSSSQEVVEEPSKEGNRGAIKYSKLLILSQITQANKKIKT
ncbi:unnamed protein product [Moneuplotes crassus]|uniref:Uncharacterized protein n=1 Tax=Euplotes crassus TaxID=5936 RepID=A0AAD1X7N5_EUPCR|nr:unnamed protein product [Moneuplotes crassus]